jgi:hypothetical protein
LRHELDDINKDSDTEEYLEPDNLTSENDATTGESSSDDESFNAQNKIKYIIQTPEDAAAEMEHQKEEFPKMGEHLSSRAGYRLQRPTVQSNKKEAQSGDIMSYLSQEMEEYQEKQNDETEKYEKQVANADTEEDLLGVVDPELLRRTEGNRHIPYEEAKAPPKRPPTVHDESDIVHKNLLVFSENPSIIEQSNKLVVVQYYGAGRSGVMPFAYRQTRKTKSYLVACDFSKESTYAIEWTMGTMMRDGDELHIAAVINREDNPDVVKSTGLDQASEVSN